MESSNLKTTIYPAFPVKLHVGRPNVGSREAFISRINDMFERNWLTNNGRFVQEFEKRLQDFLGVKHCIAMCNATVALEITTRALGLRGEVIVPAFTFVATAHSLQWQEITPVFCDVDPKTHTLDPAQIERLITPRTSGIIGVHLWGRACKIEELEDIAVKYNLKLMFDAAHAFGCSHKGHMIGGFGDAEVFSFHATKFFNTFEGGLVATNNDELADQIRLMKNFGFRGYDNVVYIGTNGKMTEICAAMGLTNLEAIESFLASNKKNYECYANLLRDIDGITLVEYNHNEKQNYQYIVAEVDEEIFGMSRDDLVDVLHANNIIARRYFYPGCHRMEPYRSFFPNAGLLLTETEKLAQKVITLPTGTSVAPGDIGIICDIIRRSSS